MPQGAEFLTADALDAEARTRSRSIVILRGIPRSSVTLSEYESRGWTEYPTKYPNTMWLQREKRPDERLEDRVWTLFHGMGMQALNAPCFTIHLKDIRNPVTGAMEAWTKQLDVVAVHGSTAFVVECKSRTELGSRTLRQELLEYSKMRNLLQRALRKKLGDASPRLALIFATQDIIPSDTDLAIAHDQGITFWTEDDLAAMEGLCGSMGEGARYQLYNIVFAGKKIQDMALRVPALKGKMGGHTFFSFVLRPEHLLQVAYVHRRTGQSGFRQMADAYQRVLNPTRVRAITKYIDEHAGFFPGNIIVCFDRELRYDPLVDKDKASILVEGAEPVMLTLPQEYGTAWIIDGQHRLYGFADTERKLTESIPVLAFVHEPTSFQAAVFVAINENQASVDSNLLWDLYDDLYDGSDIEKQCRQRTISRIAKKLNREAWSPFRGMIHIPVEGNSGAPLNMRAICHTIEKHHLVDRQIGRLYSEDWDTTVDYAARRIGAFYEAFRRSMPTQWAAGEEHFICTKSGFISLTGILHDLVQQNVSAENLHSLAKFQTEVTGLLQPAVRHLQDASAAQVKAYRATGGAEAGARTIRAEFTELMDIRSDFLRAWHNQNAAPAVAGETLLPYLAAGEGDELEFKASARLNVRKYLHTGAIEKSADLAVEGFLKTVVGFLNARGGEVLIGIVEPRELAGASPDIVSSLVSVEDHYVCGADLEYDASGADGYERMLRALLHEHIGSAVVASGLVKIRRLEPFQHKDIWVVSAERAGRKQYLDSLHFYVRLGNETQELHGHAADEYWETRNA